MSVSIEMINTMDYAINKIGDEYERYSKLVSKYDKEINDLYHTIEVNKYNASQGYKELMKLKNVLQKRRVAKHELSLLHRLKDTFETTKFKDKLKSAKDSTEKKYKVYLEQTSDWNVDLTKD